MILQGLIFIFKVESATYIHLAIKRNPLYFICLNAHNKKRASVLRRIFQKVAFLCETLTSYLPCSSGPAILKNIKIDKYHNSKSQANSAPLWNLFTFCSVEVRTSVKLNFLFKWWPQVMMVTMKSKSNFPALKNTFKWFPRHSPKRLLVTNALPAYDEKLVRILLIMDTVTSYRSILYSFWPAR